MHQLDTIFGQFKLAKHPTHKKDTLLPFDSADKHILNWVNDNLSPRAVLVVNDDFGAITIPLVQQGFSVLCYTDSATALANIKQNLIINELTSNKIVFASCIDDLMKFATDDSFSDLNYCLGRIPKSHSHLKLIIDAVAALEINQQVLGIMAKHLTKSTVELIESVYQVAEPSLAWKKSRIVVSSNLRKDSPSRIESGFAKDKTLKNVSDLNEISQLSKNLIPTSKYSYKDLLISNLPGVFAQSNVDIGARLMLETIDELNLNKYSKSNCKSSLNIADLGCGNGILGNYWLSLRSKDNIKFFDDSYLALTCSALNTVNNHSELFESKASESGPKSEIEYYHTDCLGLELKAEDQKALTLHNNDWISFKDLPSIEGSLDAVLCNPPFHSQFKLNDQISIRMFRQAKQALKKGGSLFVVGNRHLNYHTALKTIFKNCKTINSNAKFVVLEATK